jgi:hypothetical protein
MTSPRLSTSARVELIRAAIFHVKQSQDRFRQVNLGGDTFLIEAARASLIAAAGEFGWQWENVEAVLDALAPDLHFPEVGEK